MRAKGLVLLVLGAVGGAQLVWEEGSGPGGGFGPDMGCRLRTLAMAFADDGGAPACAAAAA